MPRASHRDEYRRPTAAEIKQRPNGQHVALDEVAEALLSHPDEDHFFIVDRPYPAGYRNARRFRTRGPVIRILEARTPIAEITAETERRLQHLPRKTRSVPLALRTKKIREAIANGTLSMTNPASGMVWYAKHTDRGEPNKLGLYEIEEGHRIYANGDAEVLTIYDSDIRSTVRVNRGIEFRVRVASRTEGKDLLPFRVMHVPVEEHKGMAVLGSRFRTKGHWCGGKEWLFSYHGRAHESSDFNYICAHEVAAQLAIIDAVKREYGNFVPLENSFIPMLRKEYASAAARARDSLLVKEDGKLRAPTTADLEAVSWRLVQHMGPEIALYSVRKEGPVKQYDWSVRRERKPTVDI